MVDEEGSGGKWKDIMDKLSSIEDLQNLTQLDILNLKNEIEKVKLSSSSSMPPEVEKRIIELEQISRNVDVMKKWKQTIDEVKFLRSKIIGLPKAPKPTDKKETNEMEELRKEIENVRNELKSKKFVPPAPRINVEGLRTAISENRKTIEALKTMISQKPKPPDLTVIRKMINENRSIVENLRTKVHESFSAIPAEAHGELETLHKEITRLETELKRIKEEKPAVPGESKDDIDALRNELFTKLDELNTKFSPQSSLDLRRVVEENRASIEKLKYVSSTPGSKDTEYLRTEINKNRRFVEELRRILMAKKPKTKVLLPPDPTLRKKMLQIEQKVSTLGRKLEKMNNLKPIKIPKLPVPPAPHGRGVPKSGDIDKMKKNVDSILSKMGDFITKEEVEKGFVEKMIKADERFVKQDLEKEMNEIKKAILRNEDHINNIVSDVEDVKREVGAVEKREWGNLKDMPDVEELKKRIEELEKKISTSEAGPVFIE